MMIYKKRLILTIKRVSRNTFTLFFLDIYNIYHILVVIIKNSCIVYKLCNVYKTNVIQCIHMKRSGHYGRK